MVWTLRKTRAQATTHRARTAILGEENYRKSNVGVRLELLDDRTTAAGLFMEDDRLQNRADPRI
jgi:hypothetical protein